MSQINVHPALQGDMVRISPMVAEMQAFYDRKMTASVTEFALALERDGPAGLQLFDCLVADDSDGQAVGFAVFNQVFDLATLSRTVFLQELFVTDVARETGAGKALMIAVARYSLDQGVSRIEWHVDRLDLHARTFFELTAPDSFKLNRLCYSVEGPEIAILAKTQ